MWLIMFVLVASGNVVMMAQRLNVYGVNTSQFPRITASYSAIDANGDPYTGLTAADFQITETPRGGQPANLTATLRQTCRELSQTPDASIILVIDRSNSMRPQYRDDINRWQYVRDAVRQFLAQLDFSGRTQVAVLSFATQSELFNDWTNVPKEINDTLLKREPSGATDYRLPFDDKQAIDVFRLFAKRPVDIPRFVFFLTDGEPSVQEWSNDGIKIAWGNETAAKLNAIGAKLFSISFMIRATDVSIETAARQTGGRSYVVTENGIVDLFGFLALETRVDRICELEWTSPYVCNLDATNRTATVTLRRGTPNVTSTVSYQTPPVSISDVRVTPPVLFVGDPLPNQTSEADVTITAANGPMSVSNVSVAPAGFFTIVDHNAPNNAPNFTPFTLQQGQSRRLRVRFTQGPARIYRDAIITVDASPCPQSIKIVGGAGQVTLLTPLGGQVFSTCDTVRIEWGGVQPSDPVLLEYSADDGATWQTITPSATGLFFRWVPPAAGTRYRVRVTRSAQGQYVWRSAIAGNGADSATAISVRPDGSRTYATGFFDGTFPGITNTPGDVDGYFAEFDANGTLTRMLTLEGNGNNVEKIVATHVLPNGTVIFAGNFESDVANLQNGSTTFSTLSKGPLDVRCSFVVALDATGNLQWLSDYRGTSTRAADVTILDVGYNANEIIVLGRYQRAFTYTGAGSPLQSPTLGANVTGFFHARYTLAGVPTGVTQLPNAQRPGAYTWVRRQQTLNTFTYETGSFNAPRTFPPLQPLSPVNGSTDAFVSMFGAPSSSSSASTSSFTVAAPVLTGTTVTLTLPATAQGQTSPGQRFNAVITNTGNFPVIIQGLQFTGGNAGDFVLLSTSIIGKVLAPNESFDAEIAFSPTGLGQRTTTLVVTGSCATIANVSIAGEALAPCQFTVPPVVNLGTVVKGRNATRNAVVVFTNTGPAPLTGTARLNTPNPDYSIVRDDGSALGAFTLNPNDSYRVNIVYTAQAPGASTVSIVFDLPTECGPAQTTITAECVEPVVTITGHDFGRVRLGCSETAELIITNRTTESADITSITLNPAIPQGITVALPALPQTLSPGGELRLAVTTTPAVRGPSSVDVSVTVSGLANPLLATVTVAGIQPTIATTGFTFAATTAGIQSSQIGQVRITNTDATTALVVSNIAFTPATTEFAISTPLPTFPHTIQPGGELLLDVTFTPSAAGVRRATITVTHDGKACPIPPEATETIALEGVGIVPSALDPLDFGDVLTCNERTLTLNIPNPNPTSALVISNVVASGDAASFSVQPTAPFTIDPGQSRSISVTFTPNAVRPFTASFTLENNQQLDLVVNTSGRGISAPIALSFGQTGVALVGQSVPVPVSVDAPAIAPAIIPELTITLLHDPAMLRFSGFGTVAAQGWTFSETIPAPGTVIVTATNTSNVQLLSGPLFTPVFDVFLNANTTLPIELTVATPLSCLVPSGDSTEVEMREVCFAAGRLVTFSGTAFGLAAPMPNPASDNVVIQYGHGLSGTASFDVIDAMGNIVYQVTSTDMPAGTYELSLDVTAFHSGTYSVRYRSGPFTASTMLVVVK
jgi:Mg-chelatase subunit ChlD